MTQRIAACKRRLDQHARGFADLVNFLVGYDVHVGVHRVIAPIRAPVADGIELERGENHSPGVIRALGTNDIVAAFRQRQTARLFCSRGFERALGNRVVQVVCRLDDNPPPILRAPMPNDAA